MRAASIDAAFQKFLRGLDPFIQEGVQKYLLSYVYLLTLFGTDSTVGALQKFLGGLNPFIQEGLQKYLPSYVYLLTLFGTDSTVGALQKFLGGLEPFFQEGFQKKNNRSQSMTASGLIMRHSRSVPW